VRGGNRNREGETIETGGRMERKTQKNREEPWGKKVTEEEGKKKENHHWSSSPPLRREYRSTKKKEKKKKTEAHASA
jgi:hypothetical protein